MLPESAAGPFSSDEWLFEIKWDGVRAIAYVNDTFSLRSRNDRELAGQFPELGGLATLAPGTVLDGEIVAMSDGRPDIQALLTRVRAVRRLPPGDGVAPVTYIIFDILEKDGKDLTALPLSERRKVLEDSVREGPHVALSVPVLGRGEEYFQAAVARGLEGVMAKRGDSPYEPGIRSGSWLKIKTQRTCDCVIAGYTSGRGRRGPAFGALLLGLYESGGDGAPLPEKGGSGLTSRTVPDSLETRKLVSVGKVGTGFRERDLADLMAVFSRYRTPVQQLEEGRSDGEVVWLEPVLVCEVAFQAVTRDGKLRIARFIRLRPDKRAGECTLDQLRETDVRQVSGYPLKRPSAIGVESRRGIRPKRKPVHGTRQMGPAQEQAMGGYHEKRNFSRTGEPEGRTTMSGEGRTFVIQEHHSHKLHYDLRLERDGVLKSWAVPKGVPEATGAKHLAVAVEDHPLEYAKFEGTIPAGEYGAGEVTIWDSGTYDTRVWDEDKIEVTLHGKRLSGHYVLVRFKRAGKNEWLVFKAGS
jgi:DNA ligase D-like protein (predicted 3'-phosphoesterase)